MAYGLRFNDKKLFAENVSSIYDVVRLVFHERRAQRRYADSLNRPEFFSSRREMLASLDPEDSPETQAEAASEIRRCSRSLRSCHSRNVARSRSISCRPVAIRI
jgi:hypothetical protein